MIKLDKNTYRLPHLELLAKQVVEGTLAGLHKSPFHGYSAEFLEHKIYAPGESTKFIDWKLFGKTDKLYTKKFEDETNLRAHFIIDNSSSMHYPVRENFDVQKLNKIQFSVLATAALMEILKKQRDAIGLSIYSDNYEFYVKEKNNPKHHRLMLNRLEQILNEKIKNKSTETYRYLHEIAENIHRRSLIVLFTDFWEVRENKNELFEALRHLKYNKHQVLLFHVYDYQTEFAFDFENKATKFVDIEHETQLNIYPEQIKDSYEKAVAGYFQKIKETCYQYKIEYIPADIRLGFKPVLMPFLLQTGRS
jgi:uncharacterized protein (DUF58 family)